VRPLLIVFSKAANAEAIVSIRKPRSGKMAAVVEKMPEENFVINNKTNKKARLAKSKKKLISKKRSLSSRLAYPFVSMKNSTKNGSKKYGRFLLNTMLSLTMFGFVALSGYVAYAYVAGNNADIVGKVGNHIVLPTGETPKVYIIQSEKSEVFQNPLFKGIEVGDNVLNYSNAGKVIIYRSSEDKVVNVISTSEVTPKVQVTTQPVQPQSASEAN
jgi:hypothetical protein